ncbi:MAG: cupredoxin domain-containing protein [Candidatus Levybacteria bacterium]|nr:cupredoxin domain-containing protein [Candidatus Levybacteria bacterium]
MNKILLIVIGLVVVVGAFLVIRNTSNQQGTQPQTESNPAQILQENPPITVSLDESGFTPKDITVKAGSRVIWINKSGKAATVSSDDHPTHQIYPRINLGEFGDSSSVQLVFDETGIYGYHNHLDASQTGTVTVE